MKKYWHCILILATVVGSLSLGNAQEGLTTFTEPFISLKYNATKKYTAQFQLGNRNYLYQDNNYAYKVQLLDLTHISALKIGTASKLGLGARYRLGDPFNNDAENEIRLIQLYKWRFEKTSFFQHQIQLEERFLSDITKFRMRYALQFTLPLENQSVSRPDYLKIYTEPLWQLSPNHKPDLEQRVGSGLGWTIMPDATLDMGLQYRLKNYLNNTGHQLFAILGFTVLI